MAKNALELGYYKQSYLTTCSDALTEFSVSAVLYSSAHSFFRAIRAATPDKLKGWYAAAEDVAVLHSPFFGSGKLEYYLAARRPGLEVRSVDAFEPVANLRRCYLRQDPVFLHSLLRLVGRRVDRRFYFGHLLPGAQRGRAGRRAACAYVLLRNSFLGKWGSFTQQRAASAAATVQCDRAAPGRTGLSTRSALPGAPAHLRRPPYIFRPQHELLCYERRPRPGLLHGAARRTLREQLPFVLTNDVPEARELYSHHKPKLGQEQFQARAACSAPGQSCRQHRMGEAIL